jgi:CelD/BcsL family acetyltransferase involved in cellulose biosynthesis
MTRAKAIKEASCSSQQHQRLDTAVLSTAGEFTSLKEEWNELYECCPSATPFQSWEWLYSWWEFYGEGNYELRLVTVRNAGGILVGLLPLMVRRWPSLRRLLLIGGDRVTLYGDVLTPYKDVLVREGWEEPVARAGARSLKEMHGWRVADLQELMPQAAAWEIFRYWQEPKASLPITDYVLIRANSWEELLTSLSRKLRKTARRTLRRIEKDGVRCEPAAPEDAGRAAHTLVELHRQLWAGRRIAPEHLSPRYEAFMEAAARRMTARGIGRISEFRRGPTVLVSQLFVFDKDFVGVYLLGASEEASRRYQFETLSNRDAIDVARSTGSEYVSFMDGATQEKLRWASEVVRSQRAILGRTNAFWVPYAGYYLARERYYALLSEAQLYLHSEQAPRWIKNAMERYYELVLYPYSEGAPRWVKNATQMYWELRSKHGSGVLRYKYESARVRREIRRSSNRITK